MRFNTFTKKCFFVLIIASFGLTLPFKAYSVPFWSGVSSRVRSIFSPTRCTTPPRQTFYLVNGSQHSGVQQIASDEHPEMSQYQRAEMEIARYLIQRGERITNFNLTTQSGVEFPVKFFNRNSRTLLIIGGGLTSQTRSGNFYASTFYDYDVIKFEYRWNNLSNFLRRKSTFLHPFRSIFNDCAEEVATVVNYMRQHGNYDQIVGLPTCYSTYTFSLAQSQAEGHGRTLFDKLIIDSSFSSLPTAICRYLFDPRRQGLISRILSPITKRFPTNIAIQNHLATITRPPILFIHGSRDWLLSTREFREEIWPYVTTTRRSLLVTPFSHVGSMPGNPCAYKYFCDQFIERTFE